MGKKARAKDAAAVALGARGGKQRAKNLSKKRQSDIGKKAAAARWLRYTVESDRHGKFVIEATHRKHGGKIYIGSVPKKHNFENTLFGSLEEASRYPYPSEQIAAAMVLSFPKTKNLDYAVIEAKG